MANNKVNEKNKKEPKEEIVELKQHPDKSKHKTLLSYIFSGKYSILIIVIVFLAVATTTIEVIVPKILEKVVDGGITDNNVDQIYKYGYQLIGLGVISIILVVLEIIHSTLFQVRIFTKIRKDFFRKLNKLTLLQLNSVGSESAVTRVTNDLNKMGAAFLMFINAALFSPMLFVFSIYMCYQIDPGLTFIVVSTIPIFILAGVFIPRFMNKYMRRVQRQLDAINRIVSENIRGIRVVKTYNAEKLEFKKFRKENENLRINSLKVVILLNLIAPFFTIVLNTALILILRQGSIEAMNDEIQIGQILAFVTYVGQLVISVMLFTIFFIEFARALPSYKRVFNVINAEPEGTDRNRELKTKSNDIEFRNVSFKLPEHTEYFLDNISFKIKEGETLGIIGPTGSGKTLIINLLLGLYTEYKGYILIGGQNIRDVKLDSIRRRIALVSQKDQLFKGSIRDNLTLGEVERTDEEIKEALRLSEADEFVSEYEEGFNHKLSVNGNNLSGGQKQRISIARAIVRKTPIFITDSASSALDNITEKRIKKNLDNTPDKITQIIISQRATSVKDADKILVVEEGKVKAFGTPEEVIQNSEFYSKLLNIQGGNDEA